MKIAILNDLHFGRRNANRIFMDEAENFFKKVFFPYIEQNQMDAIFLLGDTFDDRRSINVKAVNQAKRLFDYIDKFEVPVFAIPGNHDIYYKNTLRPNSVEPLIADYKNFNFVDEPTTVKFDKVKFLLVPWICAENEDACVEAIRNVEADILCLHTDIMGSQSVPGIFLDHGFDPAAFLKYDMVLNGHIHTRSSFNNVKNLGTQYQSEWSDYGQTKGFHVFDTETRQLVFHENPSMIYEKFYYTQDLVEGIDPLDWIKTNGWRMENKFIKFVVTEREDKYLFERFLTECHKIKTHELNFIENVTDVVSDEEFNPEIFDQAKSTLHIIKDYVDQVVRTDLNKPLLMQLLTQLHTEAVNKT